MKNKILYIGMCALWLSSCKSLEDKLLEPKIYFQDPITTIEVAEDDALKIDISCRLTSKTDTKEEVVYYIADSSVVKNYNSKNGTNYVYFSPTNVSMPTTQTVIEGGNIIANPLELTLNNLNTVKPGVNLLLPIGIKKSSIATITGEDIKYYVLKKPIVINSVWDTYATSSSWKRGASIKIPFLPSTPFKSVTYEAMIYINGFNDNNTIMGGEGKLIFRIGDEGGGLDRHILQIAGNKQFQVPDAMKLEAHKWYHVAFTYNQPTGEACIYINGEQCSKGNWDVPVFDLSGGAGGFFIGKVAGFMWGERPFNGYMCEVRVWNVARSAKDLINNMLDVNPTTPGLIVYYKLNGKDQYKGDDGKYYIKNISGYTTSTMDGLCNGGASALSFKQLDSPLTTKLIN